MFSERRDRAGGFTLIEVMVVLVIVGLLASIVGINVKSHIDNGRKRKAQADLSVLSSQIKVFYANNGRYPKTSEGLEILVPDYVEKLPKDPWGNLYQYEFPGRAGAFDVICFGSDGREGGEGIAADLTNWDLEETEAR